MNLPSVDISGFISSSWVWVAVVALIGLILIIAMVLVFFFLTYNRKVVFFENVSGMGFQPVKKKRARIIKLGIGGEEILKVMGGDYLSAYGRKMGRNTFWFAKGEDGYWYNSLLGDLDAKKAILDIEPIEKDVRMFHVAKDRLNKETYGKTSFMERYGIHIILFFFLVTLVLGIWFIVGKVGDATSALAVTAETNKEVAQANKEVLVALNNILDQNPKIGGT